LLPLVHFLKQGLLLILKTILFTSPLLDHVLGLCLFKDLLLESSLGLLGLR
jgi:hypothetical protein